MLRLKSLSNKFQKRTLRAEYSQTKATPYDAALDASIGSGTTFRKPLAADTTPLARSADAFTYQSGLVPGTVLVRGAGDSVLVAPGGNTAVQPFGLLANFVGGNLDELGDEIRIGAWRGVGSTYTVLAPAFDDTGLAAAYATFVTTPSAPVLLYAGVDGRLVYISSPGSRVPVARLIERISAQVIRIDLLV